MKLSRSFHIPILITAVCAVVVLLQVGIAEAGPGCKGCQRHGGESAEEAGGGGCPGAQAESGCCGMGRGKQAGQQAGHRGGGGHGKGGGSDHDMIHALLDHHEAIQREVKQIEGGVETLTTSEDAEVTEMIREHVADMKERMESGHGMRWWDPTFAEIFKHHDKIEMTIEEIPGGVRVRETSTDPKVVALIRQHAERAVSEFVEGGRDRAHEPTPLPEGYEAAEEAVQSSGAGPAEAP